MVTAVLTAAIICSGASVVLAERGPMPDFGEPPPGMERGDEKFEARVIEV